MRHILRSSNEAQLEWIIVVQLLLKYRDYAQNPSISVIPIAPMLYDPDTPIEDFPQKEGHDLGHSFSLEVCNVLKAQLT